MNVKRDWKFVREESEKRDDRVSITQGIFWQIEISRSNVENSRVATTVEEITRRLSPSPCRNKRRS